VSTYSPVAGDPGPLRSFDPVQVGHLECATWAAYYQRQWGRVLLATLRLVHRAFGLDWARTLHAAWLVLRAQQRWAPYPRNDPDGARRCMTRFYALVRLAYGRPADPARAAALEVDWWAAHRVSQRVPGSPSPTALISSLARLYAYLYGARETDVTLAAEQRAAAMLWFREWVARGCPPDDPAVLEARKALVRSYAALLAEVHR
jgi:hypothetical protein